MELWDYLLLLLLRDKGSTVSGNRAPPPGSFLPSTAKNTHLDGASHPEGMGEDVSVRVQDVQPLGFLLMVGHVLQPQEA